jgi:hypothetical protein
LTDGMPPAWTTYIATDDADATVETATAHGGTVMAPPFDVLDAGRMAVLADPTGAVFGLWQAKAHIGASFVNEPGSWCWSHLLTTDKGAAEAFYAAVFGWTSQRDPSWGEYLALGEGEIASAGDMEGVPAGVPPHWDVAFLVDDADAAIARATELGATALGSVTDFGPGGRTGSLSDPQGATFSVMSFPAQAG